MVAKMKTVGFMTINGAANCPQLHVRTGAFSPHRRPPTGTSGACGQRRSIRKVFELRLLPVQDTGAGLRRNPAAGPVPAPAALSKYVRAPTGQMPPYTAKVLPDADLTNIYAFLQSRPVPPAVEDIPLLK
jgi:hypothetical protein